MTAPPTFFEGPEKKVELAVQSVHRSLRSLGPSFWSEVVEAAQAEILSERSNDHFTAYLLSESSLFVYDEFFTMITCGRTTLVDAVARVLEVVDREALEYVIYERKNEHFPSDQVTGFYQDAKQLDAMVPGRAVRFGVEHEHALRVFHTSKPYEPEADDRTIEVLMHDIDPAVGSEFIGGGATLEARLGMPRVLEGFTLDEHVFEPAGYSVNGMRGDAYVTVHVTPERLGSYVSFETNAGFEARDLPWVVSEVVGRFRPESFDVIAFEPGGKPLRLEIPGYHRRREVHEPICGYGVSFLHFYRPAPEPVRAQVVPL